MKKSLCLFILVFANSVSSTDIPSNDFQSMKIVFPDYDKGAMTLPVALIYDEKGILVSNLFGKDIYNLNNYDIYPKKVKSLKVSTPNVKTILSKAKLKKSKNNKTIIYLGIEICPPCFSILDEFNSQVRPIIGDDFEIFFLNILVE